jgi:uncharacterized protein YjbI with pentapeptide repeats
MDPTVVAAWIAAGVSVLTLIGTLAAQYLGYRAASRDAEKTAEEQREQLDRTFAEQNQQVDRTLAEQRQHLDRTLDAQSQQLDRTLGEQRTRTLNERFAMAAGQMGSDKPPEVRLAGVYAMAGLADDWEENRQTCVDVLCAYLRMPYQHDPGEGGSVVEQLAFQANREVRHTVIRVITAHLQEGASVSWEELHFDFTGVVFDGGNFKGARFSGGQVSFSDTEFSSGRIYFNSAQFSGGMVDFTRARFTDGIVDFSSAEFSGSAVDFHFAEFSGSWVIFSFAQFLDGPVSFWNSTFSNGKIEFDYATFSGGEIDFEHAEFSGGEVDFNEAEFSGSAVDFSGVVDWSNPPAFPWAETSPQGVRLPHGETA